MYQKEILKIIYNNDEYNYMILNQKMQIVECSETMFSFFDFKKGEILNVDVFELMPEFIGMQDDFKDVLAEQMDSFVIPNVFKAPATYVNIYINKIKKQPSLSTEKEQNILLILLKDVSKEMVIHTKMTQEYNEKMLLLTEIAQKNRQLKEFNEKMEELVEVEIKKNLEKQKMFELQSRHAQMGEMIAMITHQWKQPLNVINLVAGMIKLKFPLGKLDNISVEKATGKITKQIKFMNDTIYDFQEFFNPLKEKTKFNVKEKLLKVVELVRYEYEIKNITLEVIENEEVYIEGFPNEYNQVILSLLSNAKEAFLSNPHHNMKIIITIDSIDKRSLVTIKDNAGGISTAIIETLFDIYITTKETGSGLGLNIAQTIIENNMNGKLSVLNVEDGAEFSIVV